MSPTLRFVPTMYAAALSGRKTQTRRVITPQPTEGEVLRPGPCYCYCPAKNGRLDPADEFYGISTEEGESAWTATYGPPGTTLPIVTTWAVGKAMEYHAPTEFPDQFLKVADQYLWFNDGTEKPAWAGKSRPAMFFPKSLYHLARQAKVIDVKAERVQDISEEDALVEGCSAAPSWEMWSIFTDHSPQRQGSSYSHGGPEPVVGALDALGNKILAYRQDVIAKAVSAKDSYRTLWDSINATRGKGTLKGQYAWNNNPWVFATTFELV